MATADTGRSYLKTFGLIALAIAGLFIADTSLAKMERTESHVEAVRLFHEGQRLLREGNYEGAISHLKDSLWIENDNRECEQTLAEAQLAAGKAADAQSTLGDILQADSTDGLANLMMGRVLVKEGRFSEAISYYHRAIYGHWPGDAAAARLKVRFELVDVLAQRGSKEELLAELLPIEEQPPHDIPSRVRIGRLFLTAASPNRAAAIFREILQEDPGNADAYAGLGDAEFQRANYRDAQTAYIAASHLKPGDESIRRRAELSHEVLMLDPTVRGIGVSERFHRSRRVVEMTLDEISNCAGASAHSLELFGQAKKSLKTSVNPSKEGDQADRNLDLAEQLWQARKTVCNAPPSYDPLALVLAKLTP